MSSKRGRKRNDALPPSRARDVQRAFRARRAAHLEALEDRVAVLEHENSVLRAALSLPASDRPPLGRGPTGKEKPKAIFEPNSPPLHIVDSLRRASVTTASTEASDISQARTQLSSTTAGSTHDDRPAQPFPFAQWDNAIICDDAADSDGSSPSTEGHLPPPLKISPLAYSSQHTLPVRATNGLVSPDSVHSRSASYSQSSSASSAGPDGFSPQYALNEIHEDSHAFGYHGQNQSHMAHLPSAASFSHFQYPISSPSSAGADQAQSAPQYLNDRETGHNNHVLNISHARQAPQQSRSGDMEPLGHRRAITEPQTLRALAMQGMAVRGHQSASLSAHPIRVPSPPPVPVIDRDRLGSKYSLI